MNWKSMYDRRATARLDDATALVRVAEIAQPRVVSQHKGATLTASGHSPSQLRRRVARLLSGPLRPSRGVFLLGAVAIVVALGPSLLATRAQTTKDAASRGVDPNVMDADFSGCDLTRAKISGGHKAFSGANFTGATLEKAILTGDAAFQKATFTRGILSGAVLRGGVGGFQLAVFDEAIATRVTIMGGASSFQGASFKSAKLRGARLVGTGGAFQMAAFDGADLTDAVIQCNSMTAFQRVSISGAILDGSDLRSIDYRSLESCIFDGASPPLYSSSTRFPPSFDAKKAGWQLIAEN